MSHSVFWAVVALAAAWGASLLLIEKIRLWRILHRRIAICPCCGYQAPVRDFMAEHGGKGTLIAFSCPECGYREEG